MVVNKLNPGDKIILCLVNREKQAYQDQYGVFHEAWVVDEQIEVTIEESKRVPGNYTTQHLRWNGYRATNEAGEEFFQNWDYFREDAADPYNRWETRGGVVWRVLAAEVASFFGRNSRKDSVGVYLPLIRANGESIPEEYEYCTQHATAFGRTEKCAYCADKGEQSS